MKSRLLFAVAAALLSRGAVAQAGQDAAPSAVTFFVYHHSSKGALIGRRGVEVSRVGSDGVTRLGSTNAEGEFAIAVDDLFKPHGVAVLFCDPEIKAICSAVRLDSEFLLGFAEFNVNLPVFETVDRIQVKPR